MLEERLTNLLSLLSQDEFRTAEDLAEKMRLSTKTLRQLIKQLDEVLLTNSAHIITKHGQGFKLEVNDFHQFQSLFIKEDKDLPSSSGERVQYLLEYFLNQKGYVKAEELCYRISDITLQNLIVHMYVAIKRIQTGQYVPLNQDDCRNLVGEKEYLMAARCAKALEQQILVRGEEPLVFPEGEIIYIAIHLAGKESGGGLEQDKNLLISSEVQSLVQDMLTEINEVFCIDLRDDLELTVVLGRHLVPLRIRLQYGMRLKNPLLGEIKEHYSLAYAMAIQACSVLERHYHRLLDPGEIAYIALALALALERQRTSQDKKTVLLVCASGAGTARLLAYKLQDMFHGYIGEIICCDEHSVKKQDFSGIDYIFTTVPIRAAVPVPICEVNFLIGRNDITAMHRMLVAGDKKDIITRGSKHELYGEIY